MIDAGAWVRALVDDSATGEACRHILANDPDWVAPAHAPIEALRTIRRYESIDLITTEQADAHAGSVRTAEVRYAEPEPWLLAAVWRYRHNISAYDAPYVALAQHYRIGLVTLDERLAHAAVAVGADVLVPRSH